MWGDVGFMGVRGLVVWGVGGWVGCGGWRGFDQGGGLLGCRWVLVRAL